METVDRAALVGIRVAADERTVDEAQAVAYATATGDDPDRSVGQGVAPPFFAVRLLAPLWRSMYQLPELGTSDVLVLHAEQRSLFVREVPIGARVRLRCSVVEAMSFGFGDGMLVHSVVEDARTGDRLVSMHGTLAIPQRSSGLPASRRRGLLPRRGEQVAGVDRLFDADAPRRYADAADDHNPLHLDDELARTAGHPSRIVHGLCTLATGAAALSEALSATLPPGRRLTYVRARFSRPVLPGQRVAYGAYATGSDGSDVMTAKAEGRPALKNAWLRFSSGDCR